jgi:hypothetical protein
MRIRLNIVNSFALIRTRAAAMGELCAAATLAGLTQRKFDARSPAFCHGL